MILHLASKASTGLRFQHLVPWVIFYPTTFWNSSLIFPENRYWHLCTICMKCQITFSWKNTKNIINLSSDEIAMSQSTIFQSCYGRGWDVHCFENMCNLYSHQWWMANVNAAIHKLLNPAGTQRWNNIDSLSRQSTLNWRCFNVIFLLGCSAAVEALGSLFISEDTMDSLCQIVQMCRLIWTLSVCIIL